MSSQAARRLGSPGSTGLVFDPAVEGFARAFDRYADLYSIGADVRPLGTDFYARVEARVPPGLTVFSRTLRGVEHRRDRARIVRDGMEHFTLQLVNSGTLLLDADGRTHRLGPGEGALVDMTRPFRSVASGQLFTVRLARDRFHQAGLDPADLHGEPLGADGGRLRSLLMADEGDDAVAGAMILQAALARVRPGASPAGSAASRRERALRFIERNLADPNLSPAGIAEAAGMSRATLYRAFQPLGGVADWMQARRLLCVRALLGRRDMSVSQAGRRGGFVNASHLTFAFQGRFGCTPTAFQRQRRLAEPARHAAEAALADIGLVLGEVGRDASSA